MPVVFILPGLILHDFQRLLRRKAACASPKQREGNGAAALIAGDGEWPTSAPRRRRVGTPRGAAAAAQTYEEALLTCGYPNKLNVGYRVDIPAGWRDNLEPRRRAHRCMSKGQGPPTARDQ
jgi:hypothetical protein